MDKVDVLAVMEEEMDRRLTNYNAAAIGEAPEALVDRLHVELHEMATARSAVAGLIDADQRAICRMERALEAAAGLNKLLPEAQPIRDLLSTVVGQTSLAIEAKRAALARVKAD